MRQLPPLNALRAFEAAARHLSFKRAADELCVTPAAVSQQVKSLEEYLEIELFRRQPQGLLLTDAGQRALPGLRDGFDSLAEAIAKTVYSEADPAVTIVVSPSFAAKWLVPRLHAFHAEHPEILVRVSCASPNGPRPSAGDLVVAYDTADAIRPEAGLMMREQVFPVWSPILEAKGHPIKEPKDLSQFPIIHDENMVRFTTYPTWEDWLSNLHVNRDGFENGPRLPLSSMAMDAALSGSGIVLGRSVLVKQALEAGLLNGLTEHPYPIEFGYFLQVQSQGALKPEVALFRTWLEQQVATAKTVTSIRNSISIS